MTDIVLNLHFGFLPRLIQRAAFASKEVNQLIFNLIFQLTSLDVLHFASVWRRKVSLRTVWASYQTDTLLERAGVEFASARSCTSLAYTQ